MFTFFLFFFFFALGLLTMSRRDLRARPTVYVCYMLGVCVGTLLQTQAILLKASEDMPEFHFDSLGLLPTD